MIWPSVCGRVSRRNLEGFRIKGVRIRVRVGLRVRVGARASVSGQGK